LKPLRDLKENISQLTHDELAALQKVADAKEIQNLWSYGHLISSSASILFGAYLFVRGDERGKHLIYGGSALLANALMDHLGGWTALSKLGSFGNETIEQTLRVTLPLAATLTTLLYSSYRLASLPLDLQTALKDMDKLMSWINMIVQVGNIYTSWVKGQAERKLMIIQGNISVLMMKIEPLNLRNENLTELAKQTNDAIKAELKNY